MKEYISIDIETTGLSPKDHRICELGAVRFLDDGEELGRFQQLVNPCRSIPSEVIAIHGITDDMVKDARPFHEVVKDFLAFLGKSTPMMAHNAAFDCRFLTTELRRSFPNHRLQYYVLDTLSFVKQKNRFLSSYSLPALVQEYKLNESDYAVNGYHRSLLDCLHVKNLWLKLEGPAFPEFKLKRERICNHGI